jgi:DNA-binding MarR family transcriptional regulator
MHLCAMAKIEDAIKQGKFDSEHIKSYVNIFYTANWLYNKIAAQLKPFGITHEQFNVLRILRGSHPNALCQKDIQSRMVAPNSNVHLIIKRLTAKDLVSLSKSDTDRREHQIKITKEGQALLKRLDNHLSKQKDEPSQLNISEAFHLNALLDKMRGE